MKDKCNDLNSNKNTGNLNKTHISYDISPLHCLPANSCDKQKREWRSVGRLVEIK